jgi:cob(I)alamin adenosyltransferase
MKRSQVKLVTKLTSVAHHRGCASEMLVAKSSPVFEATGALRELNSWIGVLIASDPVNHYKSVLSGHPGGFASLS